MSHLTMGATAFRFANETRLKATGNIKRASGRDIPESKQSLRRREQQELDRKSLWARTGKFPGTGSTEQADKAGTKERHRKNIARASGAKMFTTLGSVNF